MNKIFNNMDELYHEFGNIFNPRKDKLTDLKSRAYDHYIAFKNMTSDHDCFYDHMRLIEAEIERLKDLGFWPSWEKDFIKHSDTYYDAMAFKIFDKVDKIHEVEKAEIIKADLQIFSNN